MNRKLKCTATAALPAILLAGVMHTSVSLAQQPPAGGPPMGVPKGGPKGPGAGQGAAKAAPAAPPYKLAHHVGKDPFYIPWTVPPPPPYVFDKILPVRLADPDVEPPPTKQVTIREEPALRVSGIMTGDGVFAILEQSNKVDIVKPGSSIDIGVSTGSRSYKVVSIMDQTVTLESVEGKVTYRQEVPLSDAPIGTSVASFGQTGGAPRGPGPGGPGSFGGRAGRGAGPVGGGPGSGRGKGAD